MADQLRGVSAREPVLLKGRVYASRIFTKGDWYESVLSAIDVESGREIWSRAEAHVCSAPFVVGDGVIGWALWDGRVCLMGSAGESLWESDAAGANVRQPFKVGSEMLVVCDTGGRARQVRAFHLARRELVWQVNLLDRAGCLPVGAAGSESEIVVVAEHEDEMGKHCLISMDAATGLETWRVEIDGFADYPHVHAGLVYVGRGGWTDVRSVRDGSLRGRLRVAIEHAVSVSDDVVLVAGRMDDSPVLARLAPHAQGEPMWQTGLAAPVDARPAIDVSRRVATVVDRHGTVRRHDLESGRELWARSQPAKGDDAGGVIQSGSQVFLAHGRTISRIDMHDSGKSVR